MVAYDAAAAHSRNTHFLLAAGLAHTVTVIHILILVVVYSIHLVGNHQGGAAGGIHLIVMVLFHDLHIVSIPQQKAGFLGQFDQQIDPHRHICAFKHSAMAAQFMQLRLGFGIKAGGADHAGQLVFTAILNRIARCCRCGKVDQNIAFHGQVIKAGKNWNIALAGRKINACHHTAIVSLCDQFLQNTAHAAVNSLNNNICHGCSSFLLTSKCPPYRQSARRA